MESLANKYRPTNFDDIIDQSSTISILKNQITQNKIKNVMLFAGPSGTGKTTLARCFANTLNKGIGNPIEVDGASNNGVDNVRDIIKTAYERSLDSKYKTIIIDECVTGETEVLTNQGFKRFDKLEKNELIAQYKDDGKIEFVEPTEWIEKDYSGKMFELDLKSGKTVMMSPNHVQPILVDGKIEEDYIKDLEFKSGSQLIRAGFSVGKKDKLTNMDKLAILLQADGYIINEDANNSYYKWNVHVSRDRKIKRLLPIFKESGFEYGEWDTGRESSMYWIKVPKQLNITKDLKSYFNDLSQYSSSFAEEFIEEMLNWDGHKNKDGWMYYGSTEQSNTELVAAFGTMCGLYSNMQISDDDNKEHNTYYKLTLKDNINTPAGKITKKEKDFSGKIYCVKVPSHKIIIRSQGQAFVTGNCHMLTNQAWAALLKLVEEPPEYTIFMLCTTDPQKIPDSIKNRTMIFNIHRISPIEVKNRLEYICNNEGFINYKDTCEYISRINKEGSMRNAIALLEKVSYYSNDINIENAMNVLGDFSYLTMFKILSALKTNNEQKVISLMEELYDSGKNLKLFLDQFISFVLDISKYIIFNDIKMTSIPNSLLDILKKAATTKEADKFYSYLLDKLLNLKQLILYDNNIKSTIEVGFLNIARMQ